MQLKKFRDYIVEKILFYAENYFPFQGRNGDKMVTTSMKKPVRTYAEAYICNIHKKIFAEKIISYLAEAI